MPRLLLRQILRFALAAALAGSSSARADELADAQRLQAAGDLPAALARIDQGLAARPRDAQLRFSRGVVLAEMKRDAEALEVFVQLNEDYPELPDPLNNIAVLHAAAGRIDAARSALEAALRNDPQHRAARENLADIYVRLAIGLWDSLQSTPPDAAVARKLQLARELLRSP